MGLLDRIQGGGGGRSKVQGILGYFNLGEWWLSSFTEQERRYIEQKHQPMGGLGPHSLTRGSIQYGGAAAGFLVSLSTWFVGPGDRDLATRMLEKAEAVAGDSVLDRHFVYLQMIKAYYAERDTQSGALEAAISACERQIAIAPQVRAAFGAWTDENARKLSEVDGQRREVVSLTPTSHRGFHQLAIIREKQGDIAEALRLCREAESQGWQDEGRDWSSRIAKLEHKLSKAPGR